MQSGAETKEGNVSVTKSSLRCALANQRCLFEGDEDRAHPGDVLRLLVGFGVEVAEAGHTLPFSSRAFAISLCQEGLLWRSTGGRPGGDTDKSQSERSNSTPATTVSSKSGAQAQSSIARPALVREIHDHFMHFLSPITQSIRAKFVYWNKCKFKKCKTRHKLEWFYCWGMQLVKMLIHGWGVYHKTLKSIKVLNLHKAYNIRVGLFVESLVSNPSRQARPRKQEREGERRTGSVSHSKLRNVRAIHEKRKLATERDMLRWDGNKPKSSEE